MPEKKERFCSVDGNVCLTSQQFIYGLQMKFGTNIYISWMMNQSRGPIFDLQPTTSKLTASSSAWSLLCFTANKMEYIFFGHLLLIDPFTLMLMVIKSSSLKLSKVYFWCYWTWNTPFYLERLVHARIQTQTVVFFSTPEEYPCACAHLLKEDLSH